MRESTCKPKMNLCEDRREQSVKILRPELIPVLILMKTWSEGSGNPCENVDLVLLILEAVCALEGVQEEEVTLQSLVDRLTSMEDSFLTNAFINFVEESARNLTSFMNLFEKVLTPLIKSSPEDDENSQPPLINMHPLNPVLGVFVSQCVSAYECLTFSQVVRLHKQWAHATIHTDTLLIGLQKNVNKDQVKMYIEEQSYLPALMELILPSDKGNSSRGWDEKAERDLGSEALRVAALHSHFGHREEGTSAVREAIRIALHDNNTKLLQHCLPWLHRLEPYSGDDALSVLQRVTTTAQELQQPLLTGWAKLEESKELLKLGKDPPQVLQVALSGGSGDCVPVYGSKPEKLSHRGTALVAMAKIWEHYGFRHVSELYCQLQGHMMSCDPPPTELEGRESCVISVLITARFLLTSGEYRATKALLQSAKRLLRSNGKSYKLLCKFAEEIEFDWSVQVSDITSARRHLTRLQSLDEESALLRSAILNAAVMDYTEVQRLVRQLLKSSSPQLKSRALELLAEVYCICGQPSLSLPYLMQSLALCNAHHLSHYTTQLWLAQAQLQLYSLHACETLATKCLLHFQACGDIVHRAMSQFLLTQATLIMAHQNKGHLEKEDVIDVIPALEHVVADFQKTSATSHLHKAALLLVQVYEKAGDHQKKKMMTDIVMNSHTSHPLTHTTTLH